MSAVPSFDRDADGADGLLAEAEQQGGLAVGLVAEAVRRMTEDDASEEEHEETRHHRDIARSGRALGDHDAERV